MLPIDTILSYASIVHGFNLIFIYSPTLCLSLSNHLSFMLLDSVDLACLVTSGKMGSFFLWSSY